MNKNQLPAERTWWQSKVETVGRIAAGMFKEEQDTSRWLVDSNDGRSAALGVEHLNGMTADEMRNLTSDEELARVHQAIVETPGSWDDPNTYIATLQRVKELEQQ